MENGTSFLDTVETVEKTVVDLLGRIGTWLAPIPSAYLVYQATLHTLEWHWLVAFVTALSIEILGVSSVVTALHLWQWNQTRSKAKGYRGDEEAPVKLAVGIAGVYLLAVIFLTILLETFPQFAKISPVLFPILASVSAVNFSLRTSQREREASKLARLSEKGLVKRTRLDNEAQRRSSLATKPVSKADDIEALISFLSDNPKATCVQTGNAIGKSSGWVSEKTRSLKSDGRLIKNGKGWEVIT